MSEENQVLENQPVDSTNEAPQEEKKEEKPIGAVKYYKEELEKTKQLADKMARELESLKTNQLKEKQSYKELYELELNKRQEIEGKLQNLSSSFVENLMSKEIEKEALALGIRPEALHDLDLIDKGMIETETTSTGRVNFLNVKEFVQSLKTTRPYWFKNSEAPKINNTQPGMYQNKELSPSEILELQKKDPARYNQIMRKKLGF